MPRSLQDSVATVCDALKSVKKPKLVDTIINKAKPVDFEKKLGVGKNATESSRLRSDGVRRPKIGQKSLS